MIRRLFSPSSTRVLAQAVRQRSELHASNRLVGSLHMVRSHIPPIAPIGQRCMLSSEALLKFIIQTTEKRIPLRRSNTNKTPKMPMLDPQAEAKITALAAAKEKLDLVRLLEHKMFWIRCMLCIIS